MGRSSIQMKRNGGVAHTNQPSVVFLAYCRAGFWVGAAVLVKGQLEPRAISWISMFRFGGGLRPHGTFAPKQRIRARAEFV
jgi:hypothetical protein